MLVESLLAQKEALPLLLWLLKEEDYYKGFFTKADIHIGELIKFRGVPIFLFTELDNMVLLPRWECFFGTGAERNKSLGF
ncbi:hypothetical protein SO802_016029 [Lithocarpus litseifolius]|uniref:Uncharacterized protein n=1 Tax=Lithocarpus litseifolius TaxID=425828 RepID=A0AAW2CXI3_9ROSI